MKHAIGHERPLPAIIVQHRRALPVVHYANQNHKTTMQVSTADTLLVLV
jgi:hypothetical protein